MKKKMIHSLRVLFSELERGILSPAFVFCVIATAAVLFFGSTSLWFPSEAELEGGLAWEYYLTMLDRGCRSEAFVFCLPLLAAFPAGISVLTDVRSGFIKEYLGRSGSRPYVVSKVILSVLSGGGGVLGGYLTAAGAYVYDLRTYGAGAGRGGRKSMAGYVAPGPCGIFGGGIFCHAGGDPGAGFLQPVYGLWRRIYGELSADHCDQPVSYGDLYIKPKGMVSPGALLGRRIFWLRGPSFWSCA